MTLEIFNKICSLIEDSDECIMEIPLDDIDDLVEALKEGYIEIPYMCVDDRESTYDLDNNTHNLSSILAEFNLHPITFSRDNAFPDGTSTYSFNIEEYTK